MSESVVARFYISSVTRHAYNTEQVEVQLQAVSRGDHNARWAKATPSGTLNMSINNPPAAQWMNDHLGEEVELLMTLVAKHLNPADGHAFRAAAVPDDHYNKGKCGECSFAEEYHAGGARHAELRA